MFDQSDLRKRAEGAVREIEIRQSEGEDPLSLGTAPELIHELRVSQIELDMQNEELRRINQELLAERARYVDLYDLAPVGYCVVSQAGNAIIEANLTLAGLLRVSRESLLQTPFTHFVHRDDQDTFYFSRQRLFETREPQYCEVRLSGGRGEAVWVSLQAASAQDTETGLLAARIAVTDISQRKRLETEQARLRSELWQAQKMDAIGTLAGGVAHDFNNILGGVLNGLSLLEKAPGMTAEPLADIQDMKALVRRGATLAQRLLGFGRGGKYDAKPIELVRIVEKTCAMFDRGHSEIAIEREYSPEAHRVLIDYSQMEQVLLSLFINGAQAMPGGGKLTLRIQNVYLPSAYAEPYGASPGQFVKLVVADTGIGMDATTRARIFEPFFTTKPPGHGRGLGLASAYGIIKNHHGIITVDSEKGKGATFTIFLPVTDKPDITSVAPQPTPHKGKGLILVVDDEEKLLRLLGRLLRSMGYDVLTSIRGREAIELVREHSDKISLVILDLTMPEMSGAAVFDAMRKIAPELKVLLSSGYTVEGQAQDVLARGCNGFLQKPYDMATLSEALHALLP